MLPRVGTGTDASLSFILLARPGDVVVWTSTSAKRSSKLLLLMVGAYDMRQSFFLVRWVGTCADWHPVSGCPGVIL